MSLSCFRRPARAQDRPPAPVRQQLSLLSGDLRLDLARCAAWTEDASYWVVPSHDGELIYLYAADHGGGGSGGATTLEYLRDVGPTVSVGIHRGQGRYALLVPDGYDQARAGTVQRPVVDNVAVLDLPDWERLIEITGSAGSAASTWDRRTGTSSRPLARDCRTGALTLRARTPPIRSGPLLAATVVGRATATADHQ